MARARHAQILIAGLLLVCSAPSRAQSIIGPAEAIDGDTLLLTGIRVRLSGIDAVELKQNCKRNGVAWSCGEEARAMMASLLSGGDVSCTGQETDVYGRLVAICRVGDLDLGDAMVSAGLAVAYTRYSEDYIETEARARQLGVGIWASNFEPPENWRKAHPREEAQALQVVASVKSTKPRVYRDDLGRCAIKGNHSRYGDWIYHLPGQTYYNQTRPEAVFCTEDAARKAGYRRSKV